MNSVETEQLTMTLLTLKELLERHAPNLAKRVEELSAQGLIKTDGAIDEIPNRGKKNIMPLHLARIIEEVQRIDDIEENKIIENLLRCGGFSHKEALVGHVFGFDNEDGNLVENSYEQRILRKINILRNKGESYNSICSFLNRNNHKTKTGRKWTKQNVYSLLKTDRKTINFSSTNG